MSPLALPLLVALTVGYVLGSIPFGLLLTRAAGLGDIRGIGSGNIGATNVLRTGNKALAAATLLLDGLKGTVAVWIGSAIGSHAVGAWDSQTYAAAGGFAAFLGHLYPVWLGFKGGKGVATYIGVLLGLFPPAAGAFCAIWLIVAVVFRYSSLAALVASAAAPAVVWLLGAPRLAIMMVPLTILLIYKHAANITRLVAGEEPKIGAKT